MPVLEAEDLGALRSDLADVFEEVWPDTLTVSRGGAVTGDDYANTSSTPSPVASNVPCTYKAASGQERLIAGALAETKVYAVKVPAGTDVKATDALLIAAKGDDPAIALQVVTVLKKSNAVTWTVLATEG